MTRRSPIKQRQQRRWLPYSINWWINGLMNSMYAIFSRIHFNPYFLHNQHLDRYWSLSFHAHYMHDSHDRPRLQVRLIAFRHVPGSHDGAVIGRHFVDILVDLKIQHKIRQITADNASNNHTMVGWIEDALDECGIPFCRLANWIWYVLIPELD